MWAGSVEIHIDDKSLISPGADVVDTSISGDFWGNGRFSGSGKPVGQFCSMINNEVVNRT
jgi:hypothetical protein